MKILVIRFSSFGDIVQAMSILPALKQAHPDCQIDWLTKESFADLVSLSPLVDKVHALPSGTSLAGLMAFCWRLRREGYTVVYDAHASLRSLLVRNIVADFLSRFLFEKPRLLIRRKNRIRRFLLFKYRVQSFPWPFKGRLSYLAPLKKLGVDPYYKKPTHWIFSEEVKSRVRGALPDGPFVTIAPSAAWEMKRWPLESWKYLVMEQGDLNFVVLGGPQDDFIRVLEEAAPDRVLNLAGKLSLIESCYAVSSSNVLICADTGLIHVADVLGIRGISLMGPTAFGHCTGDSIKTLEVELSCRPCTKDGRGNCSQDVWQKCMTEISPQRVASTMREMLNQ